MGCKKYGPGIISVEIESSFNAATTLTTTAECQALTMPALNYEVIENTANRPNRGSNPPLKGNQSELAFEVTMLLQNTAASGSTVAKLRMMGGISADYNNLPYMNTVCPAITGQIVRIDRDGKFVEILNGCIISTITQNWATTDKCTEVFAGTASRKTVYGQLFSNLDLTGKVVDDEVDINFMHQGDWVYSRPDGLSIGIYNAERQWLAAGYFTSAGKFKLASVSDDSTITDFVGTNILYTTYQTTQETISGVVGPATWEFQFNHNGNDLNVAPSVFTLTYETGIKYGNLTVNGGGVPTQIDYGSPKATGTFAVYLDQEADKLLMIEDFSTMIKLKHGGNDVLTLNHCHIDTKPSVELSQAEAAAGDFSFQATDDDMGDCEMIKFN